MNEDIVRVLKLWDWPVFERDTLDRLQDKRRVLHDGQFWRSKSLISLVILSVLTAMLENYLDLDAANLKCDKNKFTSSHVPSVWASSYMCLQLSYVSHEKSAPAQLYIVKVAHFGKRGVNY